MMASLRVEVTESSTNKRHTLSKSEFNPGPTKTVTLNTQRPRSSLANFEIKLKQLAGDVTWAAPQNLGERAFLKSAQVVPWR